MTRLERLERLERRLALWREEIGSPEWKPGLPEAIIADLEAEIARVRARPVQ